MKKVGEYIIYRNDVCLIMEIKENDLNKKLCYTLVPEKDKTLKMNIPVDNEHIRDIMTKEEVEQLVKSMKDIQPIHIEEKLLEGEYKRLLKEESNENLIKIIKTTYLRNQERIKNNKKISDKDNRYFEIAENYLYTEIATVLSIDFEEAKEYVISYVNQTVTENL